MRAHGVGTIFAVGGDHTTPLAEACDDAGVRIVDARDERGAAWMAAGWALATGEPGVVMVSNTGALTNAAASLADSNASGTPVVCLSGAVATHHRGRGYSGDADQVALARPWVKFADVAPSPDDASELTARALHAAVEGRPGATVASLPLDVQRGAATVEAAQPLPLRPPGPDANALAAARAALASAARPVIIAGSGCWWSGAHEALRRLVETARIPVFTVRAARGLVPDHHELAFGFPNALAETTQAALAEADVALVVGADLDVLAGDGAFHAGCTVIRIDPVPWAASDGRAPEIQLVADARRALEELSADAAALPTAPWVRHLRALADARARQIRARGRITSVPLHPGRLVAEVIATLPANAVVCVDGGSVALWALDALTAAEPASLHVSTGSPTGALGMGLPWAVGIKLAHPDRPVLALVGDGSFGPTAMELETAGRHGAPVAVVIGNDGGRGMVRHLQHELNGRPVASDLPRSPYEMLAEFAGGVGDVVRTPRQLAIAVTNALAAPVPSVVNAMIDRGARHDAISLIASTFSPEEEPLSG